MEYTIDNPPKDRPDFEDPVPVSYTPFSEIAEERRPEDGYTMSPDFKAIIEKHKAEGWINLSEDRKAFVVCYIRDGYTTSVMTQMGCSVEEAELYMRDPLVRAAINDVSDQYAAINTFSAVGWRAKLARAIDMASGDTPMPFGVKGTSKSIMVRNVDLPTLARLLELAVKYRDIKDDPNDATFERFAKLPWESR